MRVAVFSTESYGREFLTAANADAGRDLTFHEPRLAARTCKLAALVGFFFKNHAFCRGF